MKPDEQSKEMNGMDGGGRRRGPTVEDNALDQIAKEAESRLAAKRQARAEAREIRMREIERQQREAEEQARQAGGGQIYEIGTNGLRNSSGGAGSGLRLNSSSGRLSASNSYHSSRRSSEDSLEETSSLGHIRCCLVNVPGTMSSGSGSDESESLSKGASESSSESESDEETESSETEESDDSSSDVKKDVSKLDVSNYNGDIRKGSSGSSENDTFAPPKPPPMPPSPAEISGLLSELTGDDCEQSELREAEDKFRKAMIGNAQLDNEKAAAAYQVDLLKDRLEELGEEFNQLQREHKEKCRQYEQMRRDSEKLAKDLALAVAALEERDRLIQEQGLVIVGGDGSTSSSETEEDGDDRPKKQRSKKRALVSAENANLLATVSGSLDVRLKKLAAERNELSDELRHVKLELEEERNRGRGLGASPADLEDIQREANKQLGDYKFKLQKAEQDVATLQTTVQRLEGQVTRYKTAAETAEKVEDELKLERRKLQRELRECQARMEELETSNTHLQRRLDKLKTAKSALLKDL